MPEKLLEYGLAGLVMGGTMYVVVQPLVRGVLAQLERAQTEISAQREERQQLMRDYHERIVVALDGLRASIDALVRRANGCGDARH